MEIINLTPHAINVVLQNGNVVTIPSSGIIARCVQTTETIGHIQYAGNTIPLTVTSYGDIIDLPNPSSGKYYIVSRLVMSAAVGRTDLLCPNGLVRDNDGNIIGCESLANN